MTPRFHPLRIAEVVRETADAVSVRFEVPPELAADYRFVPGQHLTLRATLDGEELRRSYSICSGLDDGELRVAIKRLAGGRFSAWAQAGLRAGEVVDVMTPDGRFGTRPDAARSRHAAGFAAGSGITPVLSIARSILAREPRSRFTLVYGNRTIAEALFHEALEDLKDRHLDRFALVPLLSREDAGVELLNGRLDHPRASMLLRTLVPAASIDEAYVCGPAGMIDDVVRALREAGLPEPAIHVERFHGGPGATAPAPAATDGAGPGPGAPARPVPAVARPAQAVAAARVALVIDGARREVEVAPGQSVLAAGVAAGLDLPYSCKGGMCSTCRARVVDGEFTMARNFALEPADLAAGFVLTCQAVPAGPRGTLSFDDR